MTMTDSQQQPAGKRPLGPRKALVAVAIALAFGAILVLGMWSTSGPDADGAAAVCEEYVTNRLKAPATADFPGGARVSSTADEWTVVASVDSENGFGALVRTDYVCTVRDVNGKWDLVSLDIDD